MCHQMSLMHGYLEDGQWILLEKYTHLRQMDITNRLKLFLIYRLIKKQCSNLLKNISFTGLDFWKLSLLTKNQYLLRNICSNL
jgi:hypothetical protein